MALPCRALFAVDGLRLHDQCPSPGRLLHRDADAAAQSLDRAGRLLLALPYMALVAYYSVGFVEASYLVHEQSPSSVGLTHRWIIKGIYAAGLWLVVLGILSVLARVIVFLFGRRSQAEVNLQIGHTTLDV